MLIDILHLYDEQVDVPLDNVVVDKEDGVD